MAYLPLPYIQLESARTNGADFFDTQWNAGYGFGVQFAGCAFADGGYLFGAMTSEDSADKLALQFQDGKYIYYFGDQTAESPATYELGEPHYFNFNGNSWSIDGVSMPSTSFSLSPSNEMTLNVYVGAVNVGGEAQNLSDVQIGYINFNGSSGGRQWNQCRTQDGQFGLCLYSSGSVAEFVEKPDFTYGGVMAAQSSALSLVGTPTKKDYKLGEPFDITGATVYLNLDDGTQRDVTDEASPNSRSHTYFNSNKIYRSSYVPYLYYRYNPVGVEYGNFQFGGREYSVTLPQTLYYTVSSDSPVESIEVTKLPDKTEYLIKESFNGSGTIVVGHLANGETAEIGDGYGYSGVGSPLSKAGTFDVTVIWYNGTTTLCADPFQITVKNGVEKLNITFPTKSEYSIGEEFNPTGITVTALYLDGTETPVLDFSVDSSAFDSAKEGAYPITVTATVDEKEYTQTITVYVFGEPKKLEDLLGTTEGMTVIRNNVKNDNNKDTVPGVDWFVFDGNTASNIYVSGNNFISFDNKTEHIKICRRDGATYYVYSQVGKLDNGHRFLKIRVEGYTYYGSTASDYALKYELFLFDDNSMFLNILQAPTNTSYLGTSELLYGTTHTAFTVEAGKAQVFSFYTTDAAQGKPWTVKTEYHEFLKSVMVDYIAASPTKREYSLGDSFDVTAFTVTAIHIDGSVEIVSDFTATSETFDGQKEGRYPVTVTAQIDGQDFTAETLVAVYGEPHNILDLINTKDGMQPTEKVYRVNYFGDVRWFVFDGKNLEKIGLYSRQHVYFNESEALTVCGKGQTESGALIQEGKLQNGHKFFKMKVEPVFENEYADYELFLFDDNSMYLNIISPPKDESRLGESKLMWGDGEINIPVVFDEPMVASFYTDNPSKGKPWTMELYYHEFIKEKMHTVTVVNGSGSGDYIEGDEVTVTADELEGKKFHGWTSSIDSIFDKAKVKNYNASGAVNPATIGNTLFYYYRTATKEPSSYSGWDYLGTINGKGQGTDTEYTYFVHAYKRNVTSEKDSSLMLPNVEIERAKDITLQDYTRQEAVLMSSGAKFTCKKTTDDLYLWVVFILYYWGDQKWSATPEIVTLIPENGSYDVLISDDNVPAEQFDVMPTSYPNYPASIAGFLVKTLYGREDKTLKFKMPAEDLTVTANYYWIEITKKPFKLNYSVNGRFDRSGMEVTAHFTNGESKVVTDYTISDLDSATVGAKTITVSYSDGYDTVSASFTVNVGLSGVQVKKYPEKQTYAVGETIPKDEIEAVFVYSDGETTAPIEDFEITGFDSDETGIKNVTVTCEAGGETYNTSFPVSVTETGENPFSGYNHTRTLRIHFLTGGYNDITDIEGETMSLTESIGNDKNLKFGGCIASQFSVNIFSDEFLDPDTAPEGDIEVYIEADGQQLKIFTGTIESAERTGGISRRNLVAYDYLKRKGSIKLKKWYKSLKFPMTQKQFRDSLFSYVGIQQAQVSLKYDNARVPDNMSVDSLTFLALIKDICLNNMCFGHINADGKFEYIFLKENGFSKNASAGYYAPEVRIPDDAVISSTFKEGKVWYPQWFWISPNPRYPYEEWEEPSDMAAYRGNLYFVRNSYMTGDADWINKAYRVKTEQASGNVYYEEYELKYPIIFGPQLAANDSSMLYLAREYSLTTPGDLLRRIGTNIQFNSVKYLEDGTPVTWTINSYIMSRTITGIRSLKDVLSAKNSAYNDEAYGAPKEVRDNADSVTQIKKNMPKNTSKDENGDDFDEPFKGVDFTKTMTWEEALEKMQENPRALEAREKPNKVVVYPKQSQPNTGVLRYNGMTVSGTGFNVLSVTSLPSNPDSNTIYLIQGEVVVE